MGEKKEYGEQGKYLAEQLEESVKLSQRKEKIMPGENVFFTVQTAKPLSYEDSVLDRLSMRFSLQVNDYSAVVSVDKQGLERLRSDIEVYKNTSKLRSYVNQIERISVIGINRVSPELSEWINSGTPEYIEIEMFPNLGRENYTYLIAELTNFLRKNNALILDSRIDDHIASIRTYANPQTARAILQGMDSVWQTRIAPEILSEEPQSMDIKEMPSPKMPEPDVKTICVLDSGVDTEQPFLKHILLNSIDLTKDGDPKDFKGHGTFVAGLAAYGNLENRRDPQASANLISVKVHGLKNNEYPYLEKRIEQAVQTFHEQAKIFSLSVNYPKCSNTSLPSDLAYTIDKLSREYRVTFVVSSGNVKDELAALAKSLPYPTYLQDSACKVFCGAEASMAVTVGGLAHKESPMSIAKVGQPSPFTRRGEFGLRGKPDVVSSAGNLEIDASRNLGSDNQHLGVISLGLSNKTLAYGIGTSYSTPAVSNILARLLKEYPDASPNLLKALLIHSAFWHENNLSLPADSDLKKSLYGKGTPEFEKSAFSQNFSPAYIIEDAVRYDEVAFIPIYVPYAMSSIFGEKRIRVTLVYNPPVHMGVVGYNLVDLDFALLKQAKNGEFKKQMKWDNYFRNPWDNVKTDVFRWQKSGWGMEWTLMITPRVRFKKLITGANEEQEYAVVITLEDPNKRLNIYDAISQERKRITKPLEAYLQSMTIPSG